MSWETFEPPAAAAGQWPGFVTMLTGIAPNTKPLPEQVADARRFYTPVLERRYDEALAASRKREGGKTAWQIAREAACLAQLGRLDEARAQAAEVMRRKPDFSVQAELPHYKHPADAEHVRQGLLRAGLPE